MLCAVPSKPVRLVVISLNSSRQDSNMVFCKDSFNLDNSGIRNSPVIIKEINRPHHNTRREAWEDFSKRRLNVTTYRNVTTPQRFSGSDLFFPMPIRDLRRTFGTRLDELNYNHSIIAKLLGHGDHKSVYRYKRGKDILREAVKALKKQTRAKIVLLAKKEKAHNAG